MRQPRNFKEAAQRSLEDGFKDALKYAKQIVAKLEKIAGVL